MTTLAPSATLAAAETAVPRQPCARVMLVDGFALVRSAFRRVLQGEADIEVVVEAADAAEAAAFITAVDVDVVVIGMSMHGAIGVGLASRIRDCKADARILFLSQSREPHWVKRAFDAGVRGFLFMKHAVDADLARAVRTVAAGESYISPELSGVLIRAVQTGVLGSSDPYDRLTRREKQVLQLIAQGKSAREIARVLGLSINTVAVHRAKAMNRLGIHKTAGLVMFAVERGLVMMD